jgi:pimeloyl-ACP methyl ester carboxylesterase
MQAELAALSNNGEHVIVAQAGHGIHHNAPELVIEAIVNILGYTGTP